MSTISLRCQCGALKGSAINITPANGNRVICCCSDCQAFATHLKTDAAALDEFGGTEIFQTSMSQVKIEHGLDKLQSLRLTKKGLLRWYASCCNTPVANTASAKIPFAGLIHTFMDIPEKEKTLGPVRAVVQIQYAKGTPTYPQHSEKFPIGITLRLVRQILLWKIQGRAKPSAFFSDDGLPIVKPIIVNQE